MPQSEVQLHYQQLSLKIITTVSICLTLCCHNIYCPTAAVPDDKILISCILHLEMIICMGSSTLSRADIKRFWLVGWRCYMIIFDLFLINANVNNYL